jgi:hypothetical protein
VVGAQLLIYRLNKMLELAFTSKLPFIIEMYLY